MCRGAVRENLTDDQNLPRLLEQEEQEAGDIENTQDLEGQAWYLVPTEASSVVHPTSPRHVTLSEARSRLYQRRSLQVNSHFAAFFKIYKIVTLLRRSNLKIFQNFVKFFVILRKNHTFL